VDIYVATGDLTDAEKEEQSALLLLWLGTLQLAGAPLQVRRDYGFRKQQQAFARTGREVYLTEAQLQDLWRYVDHSTATLVIPGAQAAGMGPLRITVHNKAFVRLGTKNWPLGFTSTMVMETVETLGYKAFTAEPVTQPGIEFAGEFSITLLMPVASAHAPKWVLDIDGKDHTVWIIRQPKRQPSPGSWAARVMGVPGGQGAGGASTAAATLVPTAAAATAAASAATAAAATAAAAAAAAAGGGAAASAAAPVPAHSHSRIPPWARPAAASLGETSRAGAASRGAPIPGNEPTPMLLDDPPTPTAEPSLQEQQREQQQQQELQQEQQPEEQQPRAMVWLDPLSGLKRGAVTASEASGPTTKKAHISKAERKRVKSAAQKQRREQDAAAARTAAAAEQQGNERQLPPAEQQEQQQQPLGCAQAPYVDTSPWTDGARARLLDHLPESDPAVAELIDAFICEFAAHMATTAPPNGRESDLPQEMLDWLNRQLAARGVATTYEAMGEDPPALAPGETPPPPRA
jgi:hypothetical protein